jgi:hypothetical protein
MARSGVLVNQFLQLQMLLVFDLGKGRERCSLDVFKECTTACGNMRHFFVETKCFDSFRLFPITVILTELRR